jgi:DNA-binding transcriptional LysR family regulator
MKNISHAVLSYNPARFDFVTCRLAVACAQTGTLSAAAIQCNLVLGAASRRLSELENALGVELFERNSRGLSPTASGNAFVKYALSVLQQMDGLMDELVDLKQGISRHIRVCSSTAAINQFLPTLMAKFEKIRPQIRVDLDEQVSDVVVAMVRNGFSDVGVFVEGPDTAGLELRHFRTDELVLVLPRGHALSGKSAISFVDTLDEPWISLSAGAAMLKQQQNAALEAGRVFKLRMQIRSFDAVGHMVSSGLGIAALPKLAALPIIHAMKLSWRPLSDAWAKRQIMICTKPHADPLVSEFRDFLCEPSKKVKASFATVK